MPSPSHPDSPGPGPQEAAPFYLDLSSLNLWHMLLLWDFTHKDSHYKFLRLCQFACGGTSLSLADLKLKINRTVVRRGHLSVNAWLGSVLGAHTAFLTFTAGRSQLSAALGTHVAPPVPPRGVRSALPRQATHDGSSEEYVVCGYVSGDDIRGLLFVFA